MRGDRRFQRIASLGVVRSLLLTGFAIPNTTAQEKSQFFAGFSIDSKKRIRQHILDQFCAATGGPVRVTQNAI